MLMDIRVCGFKMQIKLPNATQQPFLMSAFVKNNINNDLEGIISES